MNRSMYLLCIIVFVLAGCTINADPDKKSEIDIDFMSGVSLVAPPKPFQNNPFINIKNLNSDWVAIIPYAFCKGNTPKIYFDSQSQWWGESSDGVFESIKLARSQGLKILLKPHVWVSGQGWTGDFTLENEEEWLTWEKSYERYMLHYATIADSLHIESFCVGLEYKQVVKCRPGFWPNLIDTVRTCYQGKVTYAANWDNYQNITFWDKVDYIGINAYFPLSQNENPGINELKRAWRQKKKNLKELSKSYSKPIVFTEYGYRSMDKAAGNQWELEHHRRYKGKANLEIQKNAYEALFQSVWNEEWFKGGFLWKWYPAQFEIVTRENSDYTPQNKPTEKIILTWYKKR